MFTKCKWKLRCAYIQLKLYTFEYSFHTPYHFINLNFRVAPLCTNEVRPWPMNGTRHEVHDNENQNCVFTELRSIVSVPVFHLELYEISATGYCNYPTTTGWHLLLSFACNGVVVVALLLWTLLTTTSLNLVAKKTPLHIVLVYAHAFLFDRPRENVKFHYIATELFVFDRFILSINKETQANRQMRENQRRAGWSTQSVFVKGQVVWFLWELI